MNENINIKYVYLLGILISISIFVKIYKKIEKNASYPFVATSYTFDQIKPYLQDRIDFIKNESGFLNPYNQEKFDMISKAFLNSKNIEQIAVANCALPNSDFGNISLTSQQTDPINMTTFQYGSGSADWYWLYGTFLNPQPCNFFLYIAKIETIPEILRKRLNLPIGAGSYYNISGGVGINGIWKYSPYLTTRGEYKVFTENTFTFNALDLPKDWNCSLSSQSIGTFLLNFNWIDNGKKIGFDNVEMLSLRSPYYNGNGGCAPCAGGAGTIYMSYTNLLCNAKLFNGDNIISVENGLGWIDRQYINTNIEDKNTQILYNIISAFKNSPKGLGKYLWLNLNLSPNLQYMLSCFPTDIKIGEIDNINVIEYGNKISYNLQDSENCKVIIKELVNISGISFPKKYEIHIRDNIYILDSSPFGGNNVTIDLTNNLHWSGSAVVLDKSNKIIGLGFMEANQIQDNDLYSKNILDFLQVPSLQKNIDIFTNNKVSFSQSYQSFFIFFSYLVIFLYLLYKVLKTSYNFLHNANSGKITFDLKKILYIFVYIIVFYIAFKIIYNLVTTKSAPRVKNQL